MRLFSNIKHFVLNLKSQKLVVYILSGNIGETSGYELATTNSPVRACRGNNEKQQNKIDLVLMLRGLFYRIKTRTLAF